MQRFSPLLLLTTLLCAACAGADTDLADGIDDSFGDGKADGALETGSPEAQAVLALVNDTQVTAELLDDDARLYKTAAYNIVEHRDGADATPGTADDNPFDDLQELDGVPYVGPVALQRLLDYAVDHGYMDDPAAVQMEVIFSPQPYELSHNVRVAELIDQAEHSIDIAMYSYSDALIADSLGAAVERGVEIRFVFDTASADRKKTGASLDNSKSARLERDGINVRWVNKIMHHKFMIVDGPRDVPERASTAWVETGSGNWSSGAATRYDENSVFFTGYPELTLRLQRDFNLMWDHSKDFVYDDTLPYELSTYEITDAEIPDDPSTDVLLTSSNFTVTDTTFRITGASHVAEAYAAAIEGATESIDIASGHLRSRPIAEALIAKHEADPSVDIRVYLDGQEYLSEWYHNNQLDDLDDCLAAATTAAQERKCLDRGFLFGYQVHQSGIPIRFKFYSYRWHYSYAKQMHHKYMLVDGETLFSGSYNYSDNAEHNTFENVLVYTGPEFSALVAAFQANFDTLWETGRAEGLLDQLRDDVDTSTLVPLVFDAMALTWDEVTNLKSLIKSNCDDINTDDYRLHPEDHWMCPR